LLLYLVRHGETDWNAQRRIQGHTDIPLNERGRAQALHAGELLARRQWDAVVSSPLSRAAETAAIIAAELGLPEPVTDARLVERNYGEAEGMDIGDVDRRFPPGTDPVGRETPKEVAERAMAALLDIAEAHPGESVIVVAHGGLIRQVLNAVEPGVQRPAITNGSIHSFSHEDGTLELIAFDDPIELESEGPVTDSIEVQNPIEGREAAGG
jgi:uncharacterized phosphatase